MLEMLTRYWWAVALRGVAALLFGLMAIIWPGITLLALVVLFGAYVLLDGVLTLTAAVMGGRPSWQSRGWLGLVGAVGLAVGIITLAWPAVTTMVLLWLIAAWALVKGSFEIIAAVRLRREIQGEWLLGLGGVLSVLFAVLLAVWPATGALALIVLIGAYAVIFGAVLIGLGLRLRGWGKPSRRTAGLGTHRPAHA